MTKDEVLALMESSRTGTEWDANCDKVKAACAGYPPWWYAEVILSGLAQRVMAKFGEGPDIKLSSS